MTSQTLISESALSPSKLADDTAIPSAFQPDVFDQHVMATYGRFPIAMDRGEGCRLWDLEGRQYLDFVA
ncbi:MAG: aspartate aminotransferase family protein, partial [Cyanobacteria bacterium J06555_13]